jgi:hypothetical protein
MHTTLTAEKRKWSQKMSPLRHKYGRSIITGVFYNTVLCKWRVAANALNSCSCFLRVCWNHWSKWGMQKLKSLPKHCYHFQMVKFFGCVADVMVYPVREMLFSEISLSWQTVFCHQWREHFIIGSFKFQVLFTGTWWKYNYQWHCPISGLCAWGWWKILILWRNCCSHPT